MGSQGTIWAELGLDLTKFEENAKKAESLIRAAEKNLENLEKVGDRMTSMGKKLSVGVTLPIVAIGTAATKMAMDTVESENLFEVSMGNMAAAARQWSNELSDSLGLNEYEIRRNVGTFNVMLNSMGLGEQAAYDMAKGLTQLAYDMASFYNLKPEEAFEKLQSGISGEIEPLKRLGIVVNETTVQTYAYTHGIAEQGEELTEQQKILARYGVIMDATSKAQGDLARTIDSPSNQLRILTSRVAEAGVELGQKFLPILQKVLAVALDVVEGFQNLPPGVQNAIIALAAMAAAAGPVLLVMGGMCKALVDMHAAAALLGPVVNALAVKLGLKAAAATAAATGTAAAGAASAAATPAVTGLGVAVNFLLGPWGLLIAGVAGLVALLSQLDGAVETTEQKMQRLEREAYTAAGTLEGDLAPSMMDASSAIDNASESVRTFYTAEEIAAQKTSMLAEGAGRFASDFGVVSDKVVTGTRNIEEAFKALQEHISEETSKMDARIDIVRTKFEILASGMDPAADASAFLTEKLAAQRAELALIGEKIDSLSGDYEQMVALKGANAEESLRLEASILKEKKAYADLTKEIEATNEELRKKAAYAAGKPWEAEGRSATKQELAEYADHLAIEKQMSSGSGKIVGGAKELMDALKAKTPNYEGNVRAISKAANVDLSVAEAMLRSHLLRKYSEGLIKLAAGGIIHKPVLISDLVSGRPVGIAGEAGTEVISPLGRGSLPAPITINITGNHIASDYDVRRIGRQLVAELRLAGVRL